MPKALKIGLALAVLLLMAFLGSGLAAKLYLEGAGAERIFSRLSEELEIPVQAGEAAFSFRKWLALRPTLSLDGLKVGNPPGFESPSFVEVDHVSLQVDLLPLWRGRLHFRSITLHAPRVNIEEDSSGRTNLQVLVAKISARRPDQTQASPGGAERGWQTAVDELRLESGTIRYLDVRKGGRAVTNFEDIDIQVSDFSSQSASKFSMQARVFGGQRSQIHLDGSMGPLDDGRLPVKGELEAAIAPAEADLKLRQAYAGAFLANPGPDSLIKLEAEIQGDALGEVQGGGRLALSGLMLGRDRQHRLPLNGQAPMQLTARRLLTRPLWKIAVPEADFRLGQGRWQSRIDFSVQDGKAVAISQGSFAGFQAEELLSSFTSQGGKLSGRLEVPEYAIRLSGSDPDSILASLSGQGKIRIEEGQMAALNLLESIRGHLLRKLSGGEAADGVTRFTHLAASFRIGRQRFETPDLVVEGLSARITGSGSIGFDGSLDYDLQIRPDEGLEALLGEESKVLAQFLRGKKIPVQIRGTTEAPQVRPDLSRLTAGTLTGILQQLLGKKERKP